MKTSKIQNGRQGAPKWPTGSGKGSNPGFFDQSTPSMKKGREGEKKMEKWKMEKINNGENSGPLTSLPVDRLTATDCNAAARAKKKEKNGENSGPLTSWPVGCLNGD